MTAPSGSSGESAHDAAGGPPPVGERPPNSPLLTLLGRRRHLRRWPTTRPRRIRRPVTRLLTSPGIRPAIHRRCHPGLCAARISTPGTSSAGYGDIPYPPMPPPYGGSPGGYYPEPGYLDGYGPSQPGMNTMALVSLISALVGVLCCIGSIVGIVFGAIAINQIKQTREEGYGLAVAGIVIGIATLLVYMIAGIFAIP